MNLNDDLTRELAKAASSIMYNEAAKLDKVDPKAVKGDFDDREDKDIDNDGDTDSSDEYLHKKRQAISKAIKNESVDLEEASMADIKKVLAAAKKAGADIKGNQIDFGEGSVIKVSIEKGKIKLDGGMSTGVEYFDTVKDAMMTFESVDLEEARGFPESSLGAKNTYDAVVRLSASLKRGSNLNKAVNKRLEGNYDSDFVKMEKAIAVIFNILDEFDREYQMN